MNADNFKKLCDFGRKYVRFDVLLYRGLYPDASKKEYMNKCVSLFVCCILRTEFILQCCDVVSLVCGRACGLR